MPFLHFAHNFTIYLLPHPQVFGKHYFAAKQFFFVTENFWYTGDMAKDRGLFAEFIRKKRGFRSREEFAILTHASPNYLRQMEMGHIPSGRKIIIMAEGLGEDPTPWLQAAGYLEPPPTAPTEHPRSEVSGAYIPKPSNAVLPVLGVLRAAEVVMAEEARGEVFPCLAEHAAQADFVVRVEGNSMYPYLLPGDYIAVKKGAVPVAGDVVVAEHGDSTIVKRFIRKTREGVLLRSDNPEFADITSKDIVIVGRVVWSHRPEESLRRKV